MLLQMLIHARTAKFKSQLPITLELQLVEPLVGIILENHLLSQWPTASQPSSVRGAHIDGWMETVYLANA